MASLRRVNADTKHARKNRPYSCTSVRLHKTNQEMEFEQNMGKGSSQHTCEREK